MPTVEENEQRFEEMGFARVKSLAFNSGLPPDQLADAIRWVAKREEEERLRGIEERDREKEELQIDRQREISFETDSRRIAQNTLIVAWIAALASIVGIIVALLAWIFPRA